MSNKEAIEELKKDYDLYYSEGVCWADDGTPDGKLLKALDMAISALEKQMPKKLVEFAEPKIAREFFGICPNCDEIYNREYPKNFCHKCGQALDWRKENESNISD